MRIVILLSLLFTCCTKENEWDMVWRKDFASPDKKCVATVFEMCCYCTTGNFPQLSVQRPGEKIGKYGNMLQGGPADTIEVKWTSPTNLLVEFSHLRKEKESTTITNFAEVKIQIHEH